MTSVLTAPRIWQNPRLAGRIPELDGVRGLAILLVLVWHYFVDVGGFQTGIGSWKAHALAPFRLTWSGVDLFFVLSGFLIGGILYDAKASDGYYRTFYGRRVHRIFPLYFIWLALFAVGLYLTPSNSAEPLRTLFNRDLPLWSYPPFLQNLFMATRGTFGPKWMAITWSLTIEEQFYLLLPLLVRKLSFRKIVWLAVACVVCAPALRLGMWLAGCGFFSVYILLPARADALGFGVLAAMLCRNEEAHAWLQAHRKYLCGAFLVLGCGVLFLTVRARGLYVFGLTWIAAFYTSLLVLIVVDPGRLARACFGNRMLVKLGTVAYAVYILHQGVNALLYLAIFHRAPAITGWPSLAVTLLSLTTVMALSALSWRLLEKPLIRHAHAKYRYLPRPTAPDALQPRLT